MARYLKIFSSIFFAGLTLVVGAATAEAATISVNTSSGLMNALSSVNPGDQIVVSNGTYNGSFTLDLSGTSANPIIIRAQNPGAAVFQSSAVFLKGDHARLEFFTFSNSGVEISGDNNQVSRNTFKNGNRQYAPNDAAVSIVNAASNNRVDYNEITNWCAYGIRLIRLKDAMNGNRIDHNYIHDSPCVANAEGVQIGSGSAHSHIDTGTILEFNLLSAVETDEDGELISVKSSGSTIRYNTFRDSQKVVNGRHGKNNIFKNNTVINTRGLQAYGDNHCIIGNRVENSRGIYIPSGDITEDQIPVMGGHPAARNQVVAGNIILNGSIFVGRSTRGVNSVPAQNTKLAENQGPVDLTGNHTGTRNLTSYDNSCGPIGTPVLVTPAMVGPSGGGGPSGSGPCATLDKNQPIPSGFGASWNTQSSQKELLLKATCEASATDIEVGVKTNYSLYIWKTAYEWSGTNWKAVNLSCSGASAYSGKWCLGSATASIPTTANWYAAYSCFWSGSAWKCGCRDQACTQRLWQLQGIQR